MTSLVVLDAGARYGLHPSWAALREIAEFHLFEVDADEAARLEKKYARDANIRVYDTALYHETATLEFKVMKHRALSSVQKPNHAFLDQAEYMADEFAEVEIRRVAAEPVDKLFAGREIHFLKLDVEGAEKEVILGAEATIERSMLGVRAEVQFAEVFQGSALFGELDGMMRARGFELLNLDYTGAGNRAGRYAAPGRYGQLLSTDAVWMRPFDHCFQGDRAEQTDNVVRLAVFLFQNNAKDLGVELMAKAVDDVGLSFATIDETPLGLFLFKATLLHLKALSGLPMFEAQEISERFEKIFQREFPTLNRFFESPLFD